MSMDSGDRRENAIRTGKGEVDDKMGGGIPLGSLTLVEGSSDSGKSVLLQHFMDGALMADFGVAFYTNENTVRSLIRQMDSLGMDVADSFLIGDLAVYPMATPESDNDTSALVNRMIDHITNLPSGIEAVFVDSITNIITFSDENKVIEFFVKCKALCDRGRTVFLVVHSHAFNESMLIRVRSLCDAHFHLKVSQMGDRMVKTMEVAKVRGAEKSTGNIITFDVEPGLGIKLIPISMAKA